MLTSTAPVWSSCARCRLRVLLAAKRCARANDFAGTVEPQVAGLPARRRFGSTNPSGKHLKQGDKDSRRLTQRREEHVDQFNRATEPFGLPKTLRSTPTAPTESEDRRPGQVASHGSATPEAVARHARQAFGDFLPEGYLNADQLKIYERLYGSPVSLVSSPDNLDDLEPGPPEAQHEPEGIKSGAIELLREGKGGQLEEVHFARDLPQEDEEAAATLYDPAEPEARDELVPDDEHEDDAEMEDDFEIADEGEEMDMKEIGRLEKSKRGRFFVKASKRELDAAILDTGLPRAAEAFMADLDEQWISMDEAGKTMYLHDVRYMKLEHHLKDDGRAAEADELLQMLFIRYRSQRQAEFAAEQEVSGPLAIQALTQGFENGVEDDAAGEMESQQRTHHLTAQNRFGTWPSTLNFPKPTLVNPVAAIVSGSAPRHLADASHKIFGGTGLPYSTANPGLAKAMQQKAIPLDASQNKMSDIEADAFFAALLPGMYASVTSVIVETRKRLGSSWLADLMTKEGGPRILDAGGAGAGILATQDVLRAEWERMHDTSEDPAASAEVSVAGGQTGGAPIEPPLGRATVLTASDTLRQRSSALLDDTTFLPRLPDYLHASDEQARERGKYDIIIAPHALWPLKEDYLRKQHVANLWSLLSSDGGVLMLLEKGVPRGFEMIAGAREFLLDKRIASPGNENKAEESDQPGEGSSSGMVQKEQGMIIAPCTNHAACPMYAKGGVSKGRKDYCHFEQRYIRPPFLQNILGARDKNHEDVQFSYVSIMRGRDLRARDEEALVQGDRATDRAFAGYEHGLDENSLFDSGLDPTAPAVPDVDDMYANNHRSGPHSLSLPRAILPPLKRTGHVILDLCTPSGTLERWTVPRSFSKQAFRDARKSSWGDLWALGAKTRVPRNVRLGKGKEEFGGVDNPRLVRVNKSKKREAAGGKKHNAKAKNVVEVGYDSEGRISEEGIRLASGGRMRQGRVPGIRDKRDKRATGQGRRKNAVDL